MKRGDKLASIFCPSLTVASIGLGLWLVLENHKQNINGCYRYTNINGKEQQCRVSEYSSTKTGTNVCVGETSIKPDKVKEALQVNKECPSCLVACNDAYLQMIPNDNTVHYRCTEMSTIDALVDLTDNVEKWVEKLPSNVGKIVVNSAMIICCLGVVVTACFVMSKRQKKESIYMKPQMIISTTSSKFLVFL